MKVISRTNRYDIGLNELKELICDYIEGLGVKVDGVLTINPNMKVISNDTGTRPNKFFDGLNITVIDKIKHKE